jgi:hypothetical protein
MNDPPEIDLYEVICFDSWRRHLPPLEFRLAVTLCLQSWCYGRREGLLDLRAQAEHAGVTIEDLERALVSMLEKGALEACDFSLLDLVRARLTPRWRMDEEGSP